MRALVTGGAGFIGSHLVKKLVDSGADITVVDDLSSGNIANLTEKNIRVRAIIPGLISNFFTNAHEIKKEQVKVITGDFVDPEVLRHLISENYTHVFHLAANPRVEYSVKFPAITTETNLMKTVELLSACRQAKIEKFIFASSVLVPPPTFLCQLLYISSDDLLVFQNLKSSKLALSLPAYCSWVCVYAPLLEDGEVCSAPIYPLKSPPMEPNPTVPSVFFSFKSPLTYNLDVTPEAPETNDKA